MILEILEKFGFSRAMKAFNLIKFITMHEHIFIMTTILNWPNLEKEYSKKSGFISTIDVRKMRHRIFEVTQFSNPSNSREICGVKLFLVI